MKIHFSNKLGESNLRVCAAMGHKHFPIWHIRSKYCNFHSRELHLRRDLSFSIKISVSAMQLKVEGYQKPAHIESGRATLLFEYYEKQIEEKWFTLVF